MSITNIIKLIKPRGFRDVFEILGEAKQNKMEKHAFFRELNKKSYYNSYYRVLSALRNKKLIAIESASKKKVIRLTPKGKTVYSKLLELEQIIGKG